MATRTDLTAFYGVTWNEPFTLNPPVDVSLYNFRFTVRDKFRGIVYLQKTTPAANGINIVNGPACLWQVLLSAAQMTLWGPGNIIPVECATYHYTMERTDPGLEDVTHYGDWRVLANMGVN